MASQSKSPTTSNTFVVDRLTNGLLDPAQEMLGPVASGSLIEAHTAPGCWGPMITPAIRGGHEVTHPVGVEGAEVGDAIVVRIRDIQIKSLASASGTDCPVQGRFLGDPFVAGRCPGCDMLYPETTIKGIGPEAVRCLNCGEAAAPFDVEFGYTMLFDEANQVGLSVDEEDANKIAHDAHRFAALPDHSIQNPILAIAPHNLAGLTARLRPFMGQLGTTPAIQMPDSHNAGDFGVFLIDAPHEYAITEEQLELRTDGHMDIDIVRAGAILVCPVKTPGGGVYMGDMHAFQGDGEIAGHTTDVAGQVTLQVDLIKGLTLDGPILFPVLEDLPYLAKPISDEEQKQIDQVSQKHGLGNSETTMPISFIGTGANLNVATDNGLQRAADVLGMTVPEVKVRATVAGGIEIGRHPGVVQVTFRAPVDCLKQRGLLSLAKEQYGS